MARANGNKTGRNALNATDRQRRALELRIAGKTLEQIAVELGYAGPQGADQAIRRALRKTLQEPADTLRVLELIRLDKLMAGLWPFAVLGKTEAIDRVLKIMDRRAKLMGLDAPLKISVAQLVNDAAEQFGLTDDELTKLHSDVEAFIQASKVDAG